MTKRYAIAVDSFMSDWGNAAGGRSLVAIECETDEEVTFALAKLRARPEMKRVRLSLDLPKAARSDHLAIMRRETHPAWFPPVAS